ALEYTGRLAWLQPRRFAWLAVIPAITQVLDWTPLSHLFVGRLEFTRVGPLLFRQHATFGPWFPIHRAYSYLLVGVSLLLFIIQIIRSSDFYRRQALL